LLSRVKRFLALFFRFQVYSFVVLAVVALASGRVYVLDDDDLSAGEFKKFGKYFKKMLLPSERNVFKMAMF
jgi:hypothetical protein